MEILKDTRGRIAVLLAALCLLLCLMPGKAFANQDPVLEGLDLDAGYAAQNTEYDAQETTKDGLIYSDYDGGIHINGYTGKNTSLVVPKAINGKDVVSISLSSNNTYSQQAGTKLAKINVSACTALQNLSLYYHDFETIDVSKNTQLLSLNLSNTPISSIDVSKNVGLTTLQIAFGKLSTIDVSKNTALTSLNVNNNMLETLDVSKNAALTSLSCNSNQLPAIDVSKNVALVSLYCVYNNFASLDVSKNTKLTGLFCGGNQLTALDVSKNTELTSLNCAVNRISALDVSKNKELGSLYCGNNLLASLKTGKNAKLGVLSCSQNQLTSLDASSNDRLSSLDVSYNNFTSFDQIKLPNHAFSLNCTYNYIKNTKLIESWAAANSYGASILPQRDAITTSSFTDVPASHWGLAYIEQANALGFMTGDASGNTFRPDEGITRGEVVTALWKAAGKPKASKASPFTDLTQGWYKDAVAWASEQGITTGVSKTSFAPDENVTREQFVTFVSRVAANKEFNTAVDNPTVFNSMPDKGKVSKFAVEPMKWAMEQRIITGVGGKTISPTEGATRAEIATMMVRAKDFVL